MASGRCRRASRARSRCSTRCASTTRCAGSCTTPAATGATCSNGYCSPTTTATSISSCAGASTQLAEDGPYRPMVLPGGAEIGRGTTPEQAERSIAASPWHRFQMPAYHLIARDGAGRDAWSTSASGRPTPRTSPTTWRCCARNCWLMVGHCGGLRQSQQIGDYVLAHAYLRQDGILDSLVPPDVPIPALAEVQVALQDAAGERHRRDRARP